MAAVKFAVFVLAFSVFGVAGELTTTLYVLPEDGSEPCPTANVSRCLSLTGYVEQAASYFLSNTVLMFLAGRHSLHSVASFHDVSNVGLVQYSYVTDLQSPTIACAANRQSGFNFTNISQLNIEGLSLLGCGHSISAYNITSAAISVNHVSNLSITYIKVSQSIGRGLYAKNVFGFFNISRSNFTHNSLGGSLVLDYSNCSSEATENQSLVSVVSSFFGNGIAETDAVLSSGIFAFVWCTNISLEFNDVTLFNNTLSDRLSVGGNMAIIVRNRTNLISNNVRVTNCHVEAGFGHYGGGIFLSFELIPLSPVNNTLTQTVTIEGTNFTRNHATGEGGGLYIITHEVVGVLHPVGLVTVRDCLFDSNTLDNRLSAGVALHVNSHNIPGHVEHVQPQYQLKVNRTTFTNSSVQGADSDTTGSAVFVFQSESGVHMQDCTFSWNHVTGLSAGRSNIIFSGEITFEGNVGINGGGVQLFDRSFLYLTPYTNVTFIGNHAEGTGGGIYVSGLCLESIPQCFYQFSSAVLKSEDQVLLNTTSVYFANNTAGLTGSAIYGGSVDYCIVMDPWDYTPFTILGQDIFSIVFHIPHEERDYSYLTSDPYEVCFCSNPPLAERNCSAKVVEESIFPGSTFTVMMVVVGQMHGTAPGAVNAIAGSETSLGSLQKTQDVTVNCTALSYTVNTSLLETEIELRVQHSLLSPVPALKIKKTSILIHLKGCPIGFTLSGGECTCTGVLAGKPGIECTLNPYPAVRRSSYSWIGYHNSSHHPSQSGIIYLRYCPPGYCLVVPVDIRSSQTTFDQDAQCDDYRVGLLCGSCPSNRSAVLGSSFCGVCTSDKFLSLIVAFAVAGVALVAFVNVSKLTVTSGEINGLIFYVNIMQIYLKNILKTDARAAILFFVSWLNLDLGIKTCFYKGMDSFAKVFLQFVFPTYLFVLAFIIIFLCRKYKRVASLMGNNSVKVLATLFFLCYAKLLRIIISVFNISIVQYPDMSTEWRWTEDGSVLFARGKHLALVVCGLCAICFSLPYTAVLTFYPCMQRSRYRCLHWIHRLKPLLDAYGGVYKDRYRFWTGLLLFVRLYLFLTFAVNVIQDSYYKTLSVLFVCLLLLSLGWVFGGVYKDWRLDVLEASYIINLALFCGASLKGSASQDHLASISVGVAFVTFLFTVIWKVGMLCVCRRVSAFMSRRQDVTMADVPPSAFSWDDNKDGGDGPRDGESTPLLTQQ